MSDLLNFTLGAAALLGSPGPGIATLVAVGRSRGIARGLPFLAAMQLGLALAAGLCAAGLTALIASSPTLATALTLISIVYLGWLAWSIASAPLAGEIAGEQNSGGFPLAGAFLLGIANPKAYLAFASLLASFSIAAPAHGTHDNFLKWLILVVVMIVVDAAWLAAGAGLGRIRMTPSAERTMNIAMALMIVIACLATLR